MGGEKIPRRRGFLPTRRDVMRYAGRKSRIDMILDPDVAIDTESGIEMDEGEDPCCDDARMELAQYLHSSRVNRPGYIGSLESWVDLLSANPSQSTFNYTFDPDTFEPLSCDQLQRLLEAAPRSSYNANKRIQDKDLEGWEPLIPEDDSAAAGILERWSECAADRNYMQGVDASRLWNRKIQTTVTDERESWQDLVNKGLGLNIGRQGGLSKVSGDTRLRGQGGPGGSGTPQSRRAIKRRWNRQRVIDGKNFLRFKMYGDDLALARKEAQLLRDRENMHVRILEFSNGYHMFLWPARNRGASISFRPGMNKEGIDPMPTSGMVDGVLTRFNARRVTCPKCGNTRDSTAQRARCSCGGHMKSQMPKRRNVKKLKKGRGNDGC